jgi:hypothetical protein
MWSEHNMLPSEIAEKKNLTERRIQQILRTNHAFVPRDKEWEKSQRIWRLKREISQTGKSKKDVVDLLAQLRLEIEGEKASVEINQYTQLWNGIQKKAQDVEDSGRVHITDKKEVPA